MVKMVRKKDKAVVEVEDIYVEEKLKQGYKLFSESNRGQRRLNNESSPKKNINSIIVWGIIVILIGSGVLLLTLGLLNIITPLWNFISGSILLMLSISFIILWYYFTYKKKRGFEKLRDLILNVRIIMLLLMTLSVVIVISADIGAYYNWIEDFIQDNLIEVAYPILIVSVLSTVILDFSFHALEKQNGGFHNALKLEKNILQIEMDIMEVIGFSIFILFGIVFVIMIPFTIGIQYIVIEILWAVVLLCGGGVIVYNIKRTAYGWSKLEILYILFLVAVGVLSIVFVILFP